MPAFAAPTAARSSHPATPPCSAAQLVVASERDVAAALVGPALEKLYGNLYACLPQFRLSMGLDHAHTYTVHRGGELLTLFVFRVVGARADLCNEVICLSDEEIDAFARHVFGHFAHVSVISLRAVHAAKSARAYPCQQHDYLEDTIIALPATAEQYGASLSKNTRRNVRRYTQSLQQDFPGYAFSIAEAAGVDQSQLLDIIALNRARMAGKNKVSAIDQAETARILSLVRECGLVGVITIDGRVCAGAISCRVGANYFLMVLAHDPAFDRYSLGFLCCYLTICACIARGGQEFHFLWGRYDYKRTFLGVQRGLDHILLYRSRLAQARHAGLAARTWWRAQVRRATLALQQATQEQGAMARLSVAGLHLLRRARQLGHRLRPR
jgi:CelD/BcsL family acetyltransferase involved in cellulose biosynthesis